MKRIFPLLFAAIAGCAAGAGLRAPDVPYEPTPEEVVQAMVELAAVRRDDLVADLGCGDGRIVIAAVRTGARGLCVDIDRERIAEAMKNARAAGVDERIRFVHGDALAADLRGVTVVMLFLSPRLNQQLRPKLRRELQPGARIVSHWHRMGDWPPQQTVHVTSRGRERPVYLWTIP
ncbi:MAG: putative methylase [Burkholderiales bacterium]|jgi:precorrin-6B methylase 2|nr:putative methylase [Burkholderiales bacterium]